MILEVKEQISLRHESQTAKVALVPRSDFSLGGRRDVLFFGLLLDGVTQNRLEGLLLIITFLNRDLNETKDKKVFNICNRNKGLLRYDDGICFKDCGLHRQKY